ncbi:MAG: 50S ribosomal protein L25/general stress protein Ctc [Deltaproteobacteria bacterium]|jgi:large subunit ribosomal protein L25|nr:50S ribosomal protein L25/general stress protein Ctc [Deltaproteobacteria bacterium]MBW2182636.1 50S ribosomal protein L25/general stress protein Ctc [Deltaproteobacteria bacterium]
MAEQLKLSATVRKEKGKGVAGRLRQKGMLPAVVYGHKTPSTPLLIDSKQLRQAIAGGKGESKLFSLLIEENGEPKEKTVMIKELQIHPLKRHYLHVDFFEVAMDEEITIPLPIKLLGEAEGVKIGGVLQQVRRELEIRCLPSNIPDSLEVDVSSLNIGDSIHLKDVQLPPGIKVSEDADLTIATLLSPTVEKEVAEEVPAEEGEEEKAAAEAEGAEGKKEEEEKKEGEGAKEGKEGKEKKA